MKGKSLITYKILLVEDNPGDIFLVQEALKDVDIKHRLYVAKSGKEAIEKIIQEHIRPDLILLDINLPFNNGLEVLHTLKTSDRHCHIPVIMLTTSSSPRDIKRSYQLQASSYLCKPDSIDGLTDLLQNTCNYYLQQAMLPV